MKPLNLKERFQEHQTVTLVIRDDQDKPPIEVDAEVIYVGNALMFVPVKDEVEIL